MLLRSLAALVLVCLAATAGSAQQIQRQIPAPAPTPGKVKLEWLGHEFYRFTSPNGVVVVTSPWLGNPDGPVPKESLARTDFILVPNAHNDDMGNPEEVHLVSGAMVFAPGPLGRWLIAEKGLKQESFRRAGIGDLVEQKGLQASGSCRAITTTPCRTAPTAARPRPSWSTSRTASRFSTTAIPRWSPISRSMPRSISPTS